MGLGRRDTAYQDSILARAPRRPLLAPRGRGDLMAIGCGAGPGPGPRCRSRSARERGSALPEALVIGLAMNGASSTIGKRTTAVPTRVRGGRIPCREGG